jgi:predicted ABC-type ATPase
VEMRVSNGGHYVASKTIEERYIKGLINLDTYFSKYTQVTIIDSSSFSEIRQLFDYSNGKVKYIDEKFIDIVTKYNLINLKSSIDSFMNSHEA